jgi:hypothetical protein
MAAGLLGPYGGAAEGVSQRHIARCPEHEVAVVLHLEHELTVGRGDLGAAGDLPARIQLPRGAGRFAR